MNLVIWNIYLIIFYKIEGIWISKIVRFVELRIGFIRIKFYFEVLKYLVYVFLNWNFYFEMIFKLVGEIFDNWNFICMNLYDFYLKKMS